MLLRSSLTPILKSWFPTTNYTTCINVHSNFNSSPNNINERTPSLPRNNSISTFTTSSAPPSSPTIPCNDRDHSKRAISTFSETDLWDPPRSKMTSLQRMFSISDLDVEVSVVEEGGGGDGGGFGHGGRSGSGFNDNDSKNGDSSEYGDMEMYYRKMIKTNPADPLLLGNYARFLKESHGLQRDDRFRLMMIDIEDQIMQLMMTRVSVVQGNLAEAEEYCERAILGSPSDANLLALYADVLWQHRRDAQRAESYFDQAVQAAPNNCYVHASYANFLWEVEEDEGVEEESQDKVDNPRQSSLHLLEETSQLFPFNTTY